MMIDSQSNDTGNGSSPSASGPAGALFEGQVGAHYLLTMLAEADPRGLPGVRAERIELQRAGEGHPLDDVIVRGVTRLGEQAVLEVQVKRTITFAPSDEVFKDVVGQLARVFRTLDLSHQRRQLAVATERTSFKITGPYQDVLRWAREVSSSSVFFGRVNRANVGNNDMRVFVTTVATHLATAGCASDDETVWQILRRFQILAFDYDAPGSQSLELALERARNVLAPVDAPQASVFWKALIATAIRSAASGGDLDYARLVTEVAVVGSFHLAGSVRNLAPRETLAEAATLAAADLRRSIAGVMLARSSQLDAVRDARDQGRYLEIRGDPGVGKSGILSMLVDEALAEGRAVVLSPERTIPGGWLAFKSALHVELGPKAFLSDLAADGGGVLFVDSLDFFEDGDKRATVIDLVRAAASVPSFQVIVTARSGFDKDEPNWLPSDVLEKLGRATPIVVGELGTEEIVELKAAAPSLRALLADTHPARAMARNLFRLSRLLEVQGSTLKLRSEVDLVERWWWTADGPTVGRRERARLLADLTDQTLACSDYLESRITPSAIEALIASGTLRELGLDRLAFRHDVLKDWGVAARLHEDPNRISHLPLAYPVPTALARGVELGARFALERSGDGRTWGDYLSRVSHSNAHASWRRWSLLAILRSELALQLLDQACPLLFENDGGLLRELIRTTIAVDSRPLAEIVAEAGYETKSIPMGVFGPTNWSWAWLARWLLQTQSSIPVPALPDVVRLFQALSASMFFADPITPQMAAVLADWLEEIEESRQHNPLGLNTNRFKGTYSYHDLLDLEEEVRHAFFLMAASIPQRAQSYLRRLLNGQRPDQTIRGIMRFRGFLAKAAPAELADLTLLGLIPRDSRDQKRLGSDRDDLLSHLDSDFLPSSPAQGPFLELLNASPEHGLRLLRSLVDHVVICLSKGRIPNGDGVTLMLSSGPRFFPWLLSYFWPRTTQGFYAVESGLMALEAWSHSRIERGDPPDDVIADILGPEGAPAAFLLVVVDILISHWPKTRTAAVPFLGSPELLSLDRDRQARDEMPQVDFFGWGAIGPKEPMGSIQLINLKDRPSRRLALERLLGTFAVHVTPDRVPLYDLLTEAAERLGPADPTDTFAEPRFMARYALNLIDPSNWHSEEGGFVYVSPPEEALHIEALQNARDPQTLNFHIKTAIHNVLDHPERSSPVVAEQAFSYAQRLFVTEDASEDILSTQLIDIASSALIVVRDGADNLLDHQEDWARRIFLDTFESVDENNGSSLHGGIRFNAVAISTLGLIHLWNRRRRETDRTTLFALAGQSTLSVAMGFGSGRHVLREIDPRLLPAFLRCALTAQIQQLHNWGDSAEVKGAFEAEHRKCVSAAISAEMEWLYGKALEPTWPSFPSRPISVRRSLRIGGSDAAAEPVRGQRQSKHLNWRSAAFWVRQMAHSSDPCDLDWIVDFVGAYADWTINANGAGLVSQFEIDDRTIEWNGVFFPLLARVFPRLLFERAAAHVEQIMTVPDKSFFEIAVDLVPAIDEVYFNGLGLDIGVALKLRMLIANRLMQTVGWRRESTKSELSVESRIGSVIAVLFFNHHNSFRDTSCYLLPKAISQIHPFLPVLERLIHEGPVPFTGLLTMSLLEVSPQPAHTSFLLESALKWLRRQPTNTSLWVDGGLGARVAKWLGSMIQADPTLRSPAYSERVQMDEALARLVQVGVAEAHGVELMLKI